jgi:hypothetical protein
MLLTVEDNGDMIQIEENFRIFNFRVQKEKVYRNLSRKTE